MCECGCESNADRYKFPGPDGSFYMLALRSACVYCDAPSGFSIEQILPGTFLHDFYGDKEFEVPLKFEQWPDSKGVAIVCGMLKDEFVNVLRNHLVGVDSRETGSGDGKIDADGADVILEEMYEDACLKPHIVEPVTTTGVTNEDSTETD